MLQAAGERRICGLYVQLVPDVCTLAYVRPRSSSRITKRLVIACDRNLTAKMLVQEQPCNINDNFTQYLNTMLIKAYMDICQFCFGCFVGEKLQYGYCSIVSIVDGLHIMNDARKQLTVARLS